MSEAIEKCACHVVLADGTKVAVKDSTARADIAQLKQDIGSLTGTDGTISEELNEHQSTLEDHGQAIEEINGNIESIGENISKCVKRIVNNSSVQRAYCENRYNGGVNGVIVKTGVTKTDAEYSIPLRAPASSTTHPCTFEVGEPELDSSKTAFSRNHPLTVGTALDTFAKITELEEVKGIANNANSLASVAQENSNTAINTASNASSSATTALTTANEAKEIATAAKTIEDENIYKIAQLTIRVDALETSTGTGEGGSVDLTDVYDRLEGLESYTEELDGEIQTIKLGMVAYQTDLDSAVSTANSANEKSTEALVEAKTASDCYTEIVSKVTDLEEDYSEHDTAITSLQNTNVSFRKQLDDIISVNDTQNTKLTNYGGRITQLESDVADIEADIASIETNIDTIEDRIDSISQFGVEDQLINTEYLHNVKLKFNLTLKNTSLNNVTLECFVYFSIVRSGYYGYSVYNESSYAVNYPEDALMLLVKTTTADGVTSYYSPNYTCSGYGYNTSNASDQIFIHRITPVIEDGHVTSFNIDYHTTGWGSPFYSTVNVDTLNASVVDHECIKMRDDLNEKIG